MGRKLKIRFVGSFPPPYGGVTIKNDLLAKELDKHFSISTNKKNDRFHQLLWFIGCALTRKRMIIGVSSKSNKSLKITQLLYLFNRRVMRKSLYFMMGGTENNRIAESKKQIKMYSCYRTIYVEMESMKSCLAQAGLNNVEIYPNCRKASNFQITPHSGLRCVFFSQVSIQKGIDFVMKAAETLKDVRFDIYGHLLMDDEQSFLEEVRNMENVEYKGVFKANNENVFAKLAEYDVLLFPTKFESEGIPGVIAESKFAGIPTIATNVSYNAQLVTDGINGLIVGKNSVDEFINAISSLNENFSLLNKLKEGALKDASHYDIDSYIPSIVQKLCGE